MRALGEYESRVQDHTGELGHTTHLNPSAGARVTQRNLRKQTRPAEAEKADGKRGGPVEKEIFHFDSIFRIFPAFPRASQSLTLAVLCTQAV